MCVRGTTSDFSRLYVFVWVGYVFALILLLFLSQDTPLHLSAAQGHLKTCRLLIQYNAFVRTKNKK
jgi:hypothetical protein